VSLTAKVRLVSVTEAGHPASRPEGADATVQGVTISVPSAVLDRDPAVLRLGASGAAGMGCLGSRMGTRRRGQELVLRDAEGREYLEEISLDPTSHGTALFDDVAHFPRLPADARGLELIVPTMAVHETKGEAVARLEYRLAAGRPRARGSHPGPGSARAWRHHPGDHVHAHGRDFWTLGDSRRPLILGE
jgi:hypothetical protein